MVTAPEHGARLYMEVTMRSVPNWSIGLAAITIIISLRLYPFQWHLLLHLPGGETIACDTLA